MTEKKLKKSEDSTKKKSKSNNLEKENTICTPWNLIGVIVGIICGITYAYLVAQIHDARVFFTGITEIEREINFRTENGLYYSYYKQLVNSDSFFSGVYELTKDKLTEHPSEMNILQRMNIYQEIFLAFLYRFCPFITFSLEPIFFYVYSIFFLHSLLVFSLFLFSWSLSGTWLSGFLLFNLYMINGFDVTRVETYMPLRENFSLPFLWIQILMIHFYFKDGDLEEKYRPKIKIFLFLSTFLFALFWQFNQFALLLQSFSLFGCQVLQTVSLQKIQYVYKCIMVSMVTVSVFQFFNEMILTGFLISFTLSSFLISLIQERYEKKEGWMFLVSFVFTIFSVFIFTIVINFIIKLLIPHEADEHINRFVLSKFGYDSLIDFDVRLYLCNGGFVFLSSDFFVRTSQNFTFPFYFIAHLVILFSLFFSFVNKIFANSKLKIFLSGFPTISPELSYHAIQAVFFSLVAMMALRMKYFWSPYVCVFASTLLFLPLFLSSFFTSFFSCLSKKISFFDKNKWNEKKIKTIATTMALIYTAYVAKINYSEVSKEITNLREFYDPDTVELMNWIINNTEEGASISGSMQLMAAVKLSTGHPVTNHPHYEDKQLRHKTKQLYKFYGRYSAEEVHEMLRGFDTKYIVMEDSICLVPMRDGCGLPYIMDMEIGLQLDEKGEPLEGQKVIDRFCWEVRFGKEPYSKFFKLVMQNKTFKIYKVLQ